VKNERHSRTEETVDLRESAEIARAQLAPRSATSESSLATDAAGQAPASGASSQSADRSVAAEAVKTNSSGQFYVSPFLTFDSRAATLIFQVRDTESGDVTRQFPAESVVERYRQDPSSRPFVLPETATGEQGAPAVETGPPPPVIGGPVAEAAAEAEQVSGEPAAGTGTGESGTGDTSAPAAAAPRVSVDLIT
jgi:hypothetical protein